MTKIPSDTTIRRALMEADRLSDLHTYRVDRHTFTIYVGGDPTWEDYHDTGGEPGVEYRMADRFDINLSLLARLNPKRPILVQLASCGGNWTEGMQMFGAILACPNPVTVLATKWARSMSSIIPLAADRFVLRLPAQYMIHHGEMLYHGLAGEQAQTAFEEEQACRKMMLDIYVARLKEQGRYARRNPSFIRNLLEDRMRRKVDFWLKPGEAVSWGFADAIFDGNHAALRAAKVNPARRARMLDVLRMT